MANSNQVTEKIDEKILRILGLTDVFDLDYSTYRTLLEEELAKVLTFNRRIPIEEFELLKKELKRVKGKVGRFTIKKTNIPVDRATNIRSVRINNRRPLLLTGRVALVNNRNVNEIIERRNTSSTIPDILESINSIYETLSNQFKLDSEIRDDERKRNEDEKRTQKESKLEGLGKGIKKIVGVTKKFLSPFQNIIDRIFKFLFFVFLGRVFTKLMGWIGDKNNQKKLEALGKFIGTFWPAIAAGVFLFLTPFGKFVRTTIGFLTGSIPKLFRLVARIKKFGLKDLFNRRGGRGIFGGNCGCGGPGGGDDSQRNNQRNRNDRNRQPRNRRRTFSLSSGGTVGAYGNGGKITNSTGVPVIGAGRDSRLMSAQAGDVILTPEDQKKISPKIGGDINSVIKGPSKKDNLHGDQLIAVRPGEKRLTLDDQQKLYDKTGFDAAEYVSDRKPKLVNSNNLKMPGQQQAMSLGGIVQGFADGGVVGGTPVRTVATAEYDANGKARSPEMRDRGPNAPGASRPLSAGGSGEMSKWDFSKGGKPAVAGDGECTLGVILTAEKNKVNIGHPSVATGNDPNNPRGLMAQAITKFGWGSIPGLGRSRQIKSPYGNGNVLSMNWSEWIESVKGGKIPSGAMIFSTKKGWDYSGGSTGNDSAISQDGGKKLWSGHWQYQYDGVGGVYGPATKEVVALSHPSGNKEGFDGSTGGGNSKAGISGSSGGTNNGSTGSLSVKDKLMQALGLGALFGLNGTSSSALAGSSDTTSSSTSGGTANTSLTSNRKAFLDTIAHSEGTDKYPNSGYNTMFTGKQFTGFDRHPAQIQRSGGLASDAAGRYQFLSTTWNGLKLPDFSPKNQDIGAIKLLNASTLSAVDKGDWPEAFSGAKRIWASFPGAGYGQPEHSMKSLVAFVNDRLSSYGNPTEKDKSGDPAQGSSTNTSNTSTNPKWGAGGAQISPDQIQRGQDANATDKPSGGSVGGSKILNVPYFNQRQNKTDKFGTGGDSQCYSTSAAMVLSAVLGKTITPDEYNKTREKYGPSTSDGPHISAMKDLGVPISTSDSGDYEKYKSAINAGKPTILGLAHNFGSGHMVAGIGYQGNDIIVNDPYGKLRPTPKGGWESPNLSGENDTKGKGVLYPKSLMDGIWLDRGPRTGKMSIPEKGGVGSGGSVSGGPTSGGETEASSTGSSSGGGSQKLSPKDTLMKALGLGALFGLNDTSSSPSGSTEPEGGSSSANMPSSVTGIHKQALDIIGKYESDSVGGYNAVNQGGAAGGTIALGHRGDIRKMPQHKGRPLTSFTLKEIMNLQKDIPGMSQSEWERQGRLHAVGRYQFIGSTLANAVSRNNIDPETKYDVSTQDKLALWLLQNSSNGIGQWVGPSHRATPEEKAIVEKARKTKVSPMISGGQVDYSSIFSSVPDNLVSWAKSNRKMIEKVGTKTQKEILAKIDMQESIRNSFSNSGLLDITTKLGTKYSHSAADNRLLNFGDTKIAAQPGEQLFSYMIPKQAANKGAGDAIAEYANNIVAQLDSNSKASKQLGLRSKGSPNITPYSRVSGNSSDSQTIVLPPIHQSLNSGRNIYQGGTKEAMFSPICPAGIEERTRILETFGVLV